MYAEPVDYEGDLNRFALEHVVYGRKNDDVLWAAKWYASDQAPFEDADGIRRGSYDDKSEGVGVW
ncbi:MAG: hypothetical protein HOF23_09500 [Rhodospirillaceae bacterium]|nr:hypothetical protein [Rhodospirillaceae bacterium]